MQRLYQAAGVIFIGIGLWVMLESRGLKYYTALGPGPGFFPFWAGAILAALSAIWLAQTTFLAAGAGDQNPFPRRPGALTVVSTLAALVLFTILVKPIGFRLAMLGFLFFLVAVVGRHNSLLALALSAGGSFGLYYVFSWLDVQLPLAGFDLLQGLGL